MFMDVFKGIFSEFQIFLHCQEATTCIIFLYISPIKRNNQPGSGAFARFPHAHPGEFTKEMLMPGGKPGGGGMGTAGID